MGQDFRWFEDQALVAVRRLDHVDRICLAPHRETPGVELESIVAWMDIRPCDGGGATDVRAALLRLERRGLIRPRRSETNSDRWIPIHSDSD